MDEFTEVVWRFFAKKKDFIESLRIIAKYAPPEEQVGFVAEHLKSQVKVLMQEYSKDTIAIKLLTIVLENKVNWKVVTSLLLQKFERN